MIRRLATFGDMYDIIDAIDLIFVGSNFLIKE